MPPRRAAALRQGSNHRSRHDNSPFRIHDGQQHSNALSAAAISIENCVEGVEWPANHPYRSTYRESGHRQVDWSLSASGRQLVNHPVRDGGGLLTELHDVADTRCISDLPRHMPQTEVGENVAWENRTDSLKGTIPLPKLRLSQRQKSALHDGLQLLIRDSLGSRLRTDQVPVLHSRSYRCLRLALHAHAGDGVPTVATRTVGFSVIALPGTALPWCRFSRRPVSPRRRNCGEGRARRRASVWSPRTDAAKKLLVPHETSG